MADDTSALRVCCIPEHATEQWIQIELTFPLYPMGAVPNGPLKEVRELTNSNYRMWMVVIALATLAVTIIRLLIGL